LGFEVDQVDFGTLVVKAVFEEDYNEVQEVIAHRNLHIIKFGNPEVVQEKITIQRKAEFSTQIGAWYRTSSEEYPLLNLTNMWTNRDLGYDDDDGNEEETIQLVEVDLVAPDSLPIPVRMTLDELKKYNPKPATADDFYELDLPVPAGYSAPALTETMQ
jgi:hypothetical protein